MFFSGMPPAMPHVKAGRLRALAVTTAKRSPAAPYVPTMEEVGAPGFDISNRFGVYVPAGAPKNVIRKLNGDISKALNLAAHGAGAESDRHDCLSAGNPMSFTTST